MDHLSGFLERYWVHVQSVFTSVSDPNQRLFALYLASSAVVAFCVYLAAKKQGALTEKTFLRFLFPRHVWSHPSAWLDVRYFFFHKLIGHFLVVLVGTGLSVTVYQWISGYENVLYAAIADPIPPATEFLAIAIFFVVAAVTTDFVAFFCHYLQHKSRILWQFHKVHHSAEVMHPISNFREHPVDNVFYSLMTSIAFGAIAGVAAKGFGFVPSAPTVLGAPVLGVLFNISGYHLRHSHVWLRWPGKLSMIFPSPAHHHVHHSCHPDHIDKNFAFMFPIWDVIFKTYHMPEDNSDVKFGIGKENKGDLTSCPRLYWVPFRDAYRVFRRMINRPVKKAAKPEKPKVMPAE